MSDIVIKVENISKQYRLGQVGTGSLSHDVNRFWYKLRGKEDPYLKIGEVNDRSIKGESEYVWSLQDINFEIQQGDAVGIIGRNGAGKSTLLKLLSKVTKPTTGKIHTKGRIASLLEVGTGFHPEMTGRENIFLNGAILGMTRKEIRRKFNEIVDFSGVERYIDTPVKRYSSGMYVRLAFAVAAHLESEILIVDEVLAVGDADFQKKCLSKMGDVSKGEGRTVLFVSHNLASVSNLCNRGILIEKGKIISDAPIDIVVNQYLDQSYNEDNLPFRKYHDSGKIISVQSIEIGRMENFEYLQSSEFLMNQPITLNVFIRVKSPVKNVKLSLVIFNNMGQQIFAVRTHENLQSIINVDRDFKITATLEDHKLMPGKYFITVGLADNYETHAILSEAISFNVNATDIFGTGRIPTDRSLIYNLAKWEITI